MIEVETAKEMDVLGEGGASSNNPTAEALNLT